MVVARRAAHVDRHVNSIRTALCYTCNTEERLWIESLKVWVLFHWVLRVINIVTSSYVTFPTSNRASAQIFLSKKVLPITMRKNWKNFTFVINIIFRTSPFLLWTSTMNILWMNVPHAAIGEYAHFLTPYYPKALEKMDKIVVGTSISLLKNFL